MKSIRAKTFTGVILIYLLLTACGATPPTAAPTQPQEVLPSSTPAPPTETPQPTATFTPEPTPTDIPTATPVYQVFRDDFTGALQPGWTWENEKPDRWKVTDDGWLQILAEDQSVLAGEAQSNLLFRDMPEGDFAVTVHLTAATDSNFQQAAIFLYEDVNNYVAINRGYCEPCFPGKGNGIFMDYKVGGDFYWGLGRNKIQVDQVDVYLRLVSKDKIIYGYYALTPGDWQLLTRLGDFFEFKRVGLGVANCDAGNIGSDLVGSYDYFEITRP